MRFLDIETVYDAKLYLSREGKVSAEALHMIVLAVGEQHRDELEAFVEANGILIEGEPGI